MPTLADNERWALERLIAHALLGNSQSRHVANFLLAWWNAGQCGGFNMSALWECDDEIVEDMTVVLGVIGKLKVYPDTLGYKDDFEALVQEWRPEVAT